MNNKLIPSAGVILLITCAVLGYKVMKSGDPAPEPAAAGEPVKTRPGGQGGLGNLAGDASTRSPRASSRDDKAWSRLAERFGEARTGLAKKVTTDLAGVFEDSLTLADMGAKMGGAQDMKEATTRQTLEMLSRRLDLTEEQKAKAAPIVAKAIEDRFEAFRELTTAMKNSPEPVMELFLYGDAVTRGEVTQDEYEASTAGTRAMLENASGYIMGRGAMSFTGDDPFAKELSGILTPDQREEIAAMGAVPPEPPARRGPGGNLPFQGGQLPAMELEKLDQAVSSARVMTSGMQQVFQGLEGLQQNLGQE